MALVTSQQFPGLAPDVLGAQQRGEGLVQQQIGSQILSQELINKQRLAEQQSQKAGLQAQQLGTRQRALGVSGTPEQDTQTQAQLRMIADNPQVAKQLLDSANIVSGFQRDDAARFATEALAAPDEGAQNAIISNRIQTITARGGDPANSIALLRMPMAQRSAALQGLRTAASTVKEQLEQRRLDIAQQKLTQTERGIGEGAKKVKNAEILDDGTVQIVFSDGSVEIKPPSEADKALIAAARVTGAELQGLRAGERAEAKASSKKATESMTLLSSVRKGIINMNDAIQALDDGAETGAVSHFFPSMRAASVKLDNAQAKMGLDVIGQTTFGALSESELAFALSSALPKKLDGPELRKWIVEKRNVQQKLANYLQDAALFLGTPGNTIADFVAVRKEAGKSTTGQPGAVSTTGSRFTVETVQ